MNSKFEKSKQMRPKTKYFTDFNKGYSFLKDFYSAFKPPLSFISSLSNLSHIWTTVKIFIHL